MAFAPEEIGAKDASVVAETWQGSFGVSLSILRQGAAPAVIRVFDERSSSFARPMTEGGRPHIDNCPTSASYGETE